VRRREDGRNLFAFSLIPIRERRYPPTILYYLSDSAPTPFVRGRRALTSPSPLLLSGPLSFARTHTQRNFTLTTARNTYIFSIANRHSMSLCITSHIHPHVVVSFVLRLLGFPSPRCGFDPPVVTSVLISVLFRDLSYHIIPHTMSCPLPLPFVIIYPSISPRLFPPLIPLTSLCHLSIVSMTPVPRAG